MNINRRRKASGFSLIELLVVVAIILIITAIAIPSLLAAKSAAQQSAAAATVRTMATASEEWIAANPNSTNGPTLALLDATAATGGSVGFGYLDQGWIASPVRNGYTFAVVVDNTIDPNGFLVTATPAVNGTQSAYCEDSANVVHVSAGGAPGSAILCEGATVLGK